MIPSPVYLSGPMTGLPDSNYPAFIFVAARLRAMGYEVVSPAEQPPKPTWTEYMRADIKMLKQCRSMVLLPGWDRSRGANIELGVAHRRGIVVRELWEVLA